MIDDCNVIHLGRRPVHFSIDGRRYKTDNRTQLAADLLRLAGLDPVRYDLGELRHGSHEPAHFDDDEIVTINNKARFVSIRHRADVA